MPLSDMASTTATFVLARCKHRLSFHSSIPFLLPPLTFRPFPPPFPALAGTLGISIGGVVLSTQLKQRLAQVQGFDASQVKLGEGANLTQIKYVEPVTLRME